MARTLTPEERNKVKNLQVSNSIYRKDIRTLEELVQTHTAELTELEAQEPNLLGDEHRRVSDKIASLKAAITTAQGQIAYKQDKIAGKENEIEVIKNKAAVEEEIITESFDPNDPKRIAERNAKAEREAAKREEKRAKNRRTKKSDGEPTTEDF